MSTDESNEQEAPRREVAKADDDDTEGPEGHVRGGPLVGSAQREGQEGQGEKAEDDGDVGDPRRPHQRRR